MIQTFLKGNLVYGVHPFLCLVHLYKILKMSSVCSGKLKFIHRSEVVHALFLQVEQGLKMTILRLIAIISGEICRPATLVLKGLVEWFIQLNVSACVFCFFLQDLGVFIPAPMSHGMRMDFFLESPFMPNRMKLDRETLGGLADMFGQMPGGFYCSSFIV